MENNTTQISPPSACPRCVRQGPAVVHRKLSAGNKTEKGAQTLGRLASLAVSCRQNLVKFAEVVRSILLTSAPEHPVLSWEKTDSSPS